MKRIIIFLGSIFLFLSFSAYAFKVGVFDLHQVLRDNPDVQAANTKIQKQFTTRGKKIIAAREQLNKDTTLWNNTPAIQTETRKKLNNKIIEEQKALQTLQAAYQSQLVAAQNEVLVEVLKHVKKVVTKIAAKEQFDLVLTQDNVAYSPQSTDITDQVVKAMAKKTA